MIVQHSTQQEKSTMINRSQYHHSSRPMDVGEPSRSGNISNSALTPPSSGGDSRLGHSLVDSNRAPDVRGCINPGLSLGSIESSEQRTSADGILGKILSPPSSRSVEGGRDSSVQLFPSETGRSESFVQFSPARNSDAKQLATFIAQEEFSIHTSDSCAPSRDELQSPRKTKAPSKEKADPYLDRQDSVRSLQQFISDNVPPFDGGDDNDRSKAASNRDLESSSSSTAVEHESSDENDAFSAGSGYYSIPEENRRVDRTDSSSLHPPTMPNQKFSDSSNSAEVSTKGGSPESYSDLISPPKSSSSSSSGGPLLSPPKAERVRLTDRGSFLPAGSKHSLGSTTSHTLFGQQFVASSHHNDDASMAYSETSVALEPSFHDSEGTMPSLTSMSRSSPRSATTSVTMPSLASFSPGSIGMTSLSSSLGLSISYASVSVPPASSSTSRSISSSASAKSGSSSVSSKSRSKSRHGKTKNEPYDGALLMMVDKMHGSGSSLDFYDSVKSLKSEYSKTSSSTEPGPQQRRIARIIDDTLRAATREPVRSLDYVSSASTHGTCTSDEGLQDTFLMGGEKRSTKGKSSRKPRREDSNGSSSSGELIAIDEKKRTIKKQDWQSLLSNHLQHKRTTGSKDNNDSHGSGTLHGSNTLHSAVSAKSFEPSNEGFLDSSNRSPSVEVTKELMDRLDGSTRSFGRRLCQSASPIRPRLKMEDLAKMRSSAPPRLDRVRSPHRRHQLLSKHQQHYVPNRSTVTERLSISKLVEELSITNLEEASVSNSGTTTLPPIPPPSPQTRSSRNSTVLSGFPPVDPMARTVRTSNRSIFDEKKKKKERSRSRPRPLTNTPLTRSPVLPRGSLSSSIPSLPFDSESSSSHYSDTSSSSSRQRLSGRHIVSSHTSVSLAATRTTPIPPPRYPSQNSEAASSRSSGSSVSSAECSVSRRSSSTSRRRGGSGSPKLESNRPSNERTASHSPKRATPRTSGRRESSASSCTASSYTSYSLAPIKLEIPSTPTYGYGDSAPKRMVALSPCSSNHATIGSFYLDDSSDESVARHARSPRGENKKKEGAPSLMPLTELSPVRKTTVSDSIWGRLEEEKRRQQKLRARLFSSRELQSSPHAPPRSTVKAF
jgi:hypothetical protein